MNKGDELVTTKGESSLCYSKSNVSRYDTGNYTCATQNEIGNASSVTSVVILCKNYSYQSLRHILKNLFKLDKEKRKKVNLY